MTPESGRKLLVASFVIAVAMVTWSEVKDFKRVPTPARYVGAGVVYGILGVAAPFISFELAGLFGVGLLFALFYQHYSTGTPSGESGPAAGGEGTPQPKVR